MRSENKTVSGVRICIAGADRGTGTTTGAVMFAAGLAGAGSRVLLTGTFRQGETFEETVLGRRSARELYGFSGMDELIRLFRAGRIGKNEIDPCCVRTGGSLYLLPGTDARICTEAENEITKSVIRRIIRECSGCYDCVVVDCGDYKDADRELIRECDALIINLPQDPVRINRFLEGFRCEAPKVFYMIGRYDRASENDLLSLRVRCRELRHDNAWVMPYETALFDALAGGRFLSYSETYLQGSLNRAVMQLIGRLKINVTKKDQKRRRREKAEGGIGKIGTGRKRIFC